MIKSAISKLANKSEDKPLNDWERPKLSFFTKFFINLIDFFVLIPFRIIVAICMSPMVSKEAKNFSSKIEAEYGSLESFFSSPDFNISNIMEFRLVSLIALVVFLIFFTSIVYGFIMHTSSWRATVGERMAGMVIKKISYKNQNYTKAIFFDIALMYVIKITSLIIGMSAINCIVKGNFALALAFGLLFASIRDISIFSNISMGAMYACTGIRVIQGKAAKKLKLLDIHD